MEGKKIVSGKLNRQQYIQISDNTISKDESSKKSIDLNRPLYDEEMIKERFDCIMLQRNRTNTSVGPIKKPYIVRPASSCESTNVRKKDVRTYFLGPRFACNENLYSEIWTRIKNETARPSYNNNNGNAVGIRETMGESNKRCVRQQQHPYLRPNSPQPKPWEYMSFPTVSEHSCVDSCSENNGDHEVRSRAHCQPAQVPRRIQVQNYSSRREHNQNSMDFRCKFCLGETIVREASHQSFCGHFFHMQCLISFNLSRDASFCVHCAGTSPSKLA